MSSVTYSIQRSERLHHVTVDVSLREKAPLFDLPVLTRIAFLVQGNDRSFLSGEEAEIVDKTVGTFEAVTAAPAPGLKRLLKDGRPNRMRYIGRVTSRGSAILYFYGERQLDLRCLVEMQRLVPHPAWTAGAIMDADWGYYLKGLHPGAALPALRASWAEIEARQQGGDRLEDEREVDHALRFATTDGRTRFSERLEGVEGFQIISAQTEGDRPFGLTVRSFQPLTRSEVDVRVMSFWSNAAQHGGTYAGWVVRDA